MTYLQRYINGEYAEVWNELFHLGPEARSGDLSADAFAVARETMRRVRLNIEVLTQRLTQVGYIFGYDHRLQPYFRERSSAESRRAYLDDFTWARKQPPVFLSATQSEEEQAERGDIPTSFLLDEVELFEDGSMLSADEDAFELPPMKSYLDEIERLIGPVPLAICAWYEHVGGVNFYGYHERWHQLVTSFLPEKIAGEKPLILMTFCDPLLVYPLTKRFMAQLRQKYVSGKRYTFEFAPDRFWKDNCSGGGGSPYSFYLPDASADAWLANPFGTFVQYLRTSILSWAGFPGMAAWPTVPQEDLAFLTEGLIPF